MDTWYFRFLYVFVQITLVIFNNPPLTAQALVKEPNKLSMKFLDRMPNVNTFRVSLIILQAPNYIPNMVCHTQVIKYLVSYIMCNKKMPGRWLSLRINIAGGLALVAHAGSLQ